MHVRPARCTFAAGKRSQRRSMQAYERFGSDATGCGQCAGSTTTYGWTPPWSTQAVVFVLPVCTVPSLHVALVVSGVSLPLTVFAAFFVPVAVSFAASSVT